MQEVLQAINSLKKRVAALERQETTHVGEAAGYSAYYRPDDSSLRVPGPVMGAYTGMMGAIGMLQMMPGLVGLWPGGVRGADASTPDAITDVSGHGLHLTRNGSGGIGTSELLAPHYFFDGSDTYFSHADANILDITGTEPGVGTGILGLTVGAWIYPRINDIGGLVSKWINTGNERSYRLNKNSGGSLNIAISSNGESGGIVSHNSTAMVSGLETWNFVAGRFSPSTELATFVNGVKETTTSGIPASIYSGNGLFQIGAVNSAGGVLFDGRIALCFLCAAAVPDEMIEAFYEQTRGLFGV